MLKLNSAHVVAVCAVTHIALECWPTLLTQTTSGAVYVDIDFVMIDVQSHHALLVEQAGSS